jgi:hypothetical protein
MRSRKGSVARGGTSKDAMHTAESSRCSLQVEQQQRNSGAGADFSGCSGVRACARSVSAQVCLSFLCLSMSDTALL